MRPLEDFCCQTNSCPDYGKRGGNNLRWHGWSSKASNIRGLFCKTCKSYFSERKGTAFYQSRLPEKKALAVMGHVAEGCGMRQTARLTEVSRDAVCRLARVSGEHARRAHDELVAVSPSDGRGPVR